MKTKDMYQLENCSMKHKRSIEFLDILQIIGYFVGWTFLLSLLIILVIDLIFINYDINVNLIIIIVGIIILFCLGMLIIDNKKRYNRYWINRIPEIVFHEYLKKNKENLIDIKINKIDKYVPEIIISIICDDKFSLTNLQNLLKDKNYTIELNFEYVNNLVDIHIPFLGFANCSLSPDYVPKNQTDFINLTCAIFGIHDIEQIPIQGQY